MNRTLLRSVEDFRWLREVHKIYCDEHALAILVGNEDAPQRIELYARDHYRCKPSVYVPDAAGIFRQVKRGERPQPGSLPVRRTDAELAAAEGIVPCE